MISTQIETGQRASPNMGATFSLIQLESQFRVQIDTRAGRLAECRGMGEGHTRYECARAVCPGRLAITLADRFSCRDHLH
jgi:hypothetical protein